MHKSFLIIGEVFTDILLNTGGEDHLSRLGGVFHSVRALSSLQANFSLAFFSPRYLMSSVQEFSEKLNVTMCRCIGEIDGSPNIMIVENSTEAKKQKYINPLCKQARYIEKEDIKCCIDDIIKQTHITDAIIFPGRYNNEKVLRILGTYKIKIHIDFHYDYESVVDGDFKCFDTVFTSTSSLFFLEKCKSSYDDVKTICNHLGAKKVVVKENRGGSCFISLDDGEIVNGDSFPITTCHSVGVGDVFDVVFLYFYEQTVPKSLFFSACISSAYAYTLDFNVFKKDVNYILSNRNRLFLLNGVRLPWKEREAISIYLAAPDFPSVEKKHLNEVVDSLSYHNFRVRLPIRENGLITENSTPEERSRCYYDDLSLLNESDLLIAVDLNNDPGMYVELGMFVATGKPAIIYDPEGICLNNFVIHAANYVCRTITELIDVTFRILGEKK